MEKLNYNQGINKCLFVFIYQRIWFELEFDWDVDDGKKDLAGFDKTYIILQYFVMRVGST